MSTNQVEQGLQFNKILCAGLDKIEFGLKYTEVDSLYWRYICCFFMTYMSYLDAFYLQDFIIFSENVA